MKHKKLVCRVLLFLFAIYGGQGVVSAQRAENAEISGTVRDLTTREVLPFASVVIKGTILGGVTDAEGNFRLVNLAAGDYILRVSYVGYSAKEIPVTLAAGEKKKITIDLDQPLVSVGEVVVSSQRMGQNAAINQQLNSNAVVNVVSKDAIRELPDVNAAEAIGRLSGVSLIRSGGEGSKVVLRGLDPKFSSVSINGIKQPGTDMGTSGDRSVDLSNISPELLSGIEVFKSPTADMDGDAIAGTINLVISKAPDMPKNQVRFYGGYTDLYNKVNNFKGSWDFSQRFLGGKFGVMAQANYEKTDRSAQSVDISYYNPNAEIADSFFVDVVTLSERKQTVKRMGGLLMLDYQFNRGGVYFTNIYNSSPRHSFTQSKVINRTGLMDHNVNLNDREGTSLNSTLGGNLNLSIFKIDWSLTRVHANNNNPFDLAMGFQLGAPYGLASEAVGQANKDPMFFTNNLAFNSLNMVKDTLSALNNSQWTPDTLVQTNYAAKLDIEAPFNIGDKLAGFIKFGGKYQTERRDRSTILFSDRQYYLKPQLTDLANANDPRDPFTLTAARLIQMANFNRQENVPLLGGDYNMFPIVDENELQLWHDYHVFTDEYITDPSNAENNYDTYETLAAGYLMFKLNYADIVTLVPGIRYEYSDNTYHGVYSTINGAMGLNGYYEPDTSYQRYGEWLPSIHLKVKPTKWMDVRISHTKTLSRPNYMWLLPRFRYNAGGYSVNKGNPDLKHATSQNWDASVTVYTGKFGLLSFGGYTKDIDNMFYNISGTLAPEDAVKLGLPPQSFDLNEDYINLNDSYVKGLEFEYNTHFNFLPSPFNRFVLGINMTRLWSGTYYLVWKKIEDIVLYKDTRPTLAVDFDKSYFQLTESRMPSQVDLTSNLWLGYEYKGFTSRVSMSYQGTRLTGINPNSDDPGYNRYTDNYLRFDLTLKQRVHKYVSVLLNLNNITNAEEKGYRYISDYPTYRNVYGFSADLGIQVDLDRLYSK